MSNSYAVLENKAGLTSSPIFSCYCFENHIIIVVELMEGKKPHQWKSFKLALDCFLSPKCHNRMHCIMQSNGLEITSCCLLVVKMCCVQVQNRSYREHRLNQYKMEQILSLNQS